MKKVQTRSSSTFEYVELETTQRRGRTLVRTKPDKRTQQSQPDIRVYQRRSHSRENNIRHSASPTIRTEPVEPEIFINFTDATSSDLAANLSVVFVPSPSFTVPVQQQSHFQPPLMAAPRAFAFVPFDQGSPLDLAQHDVIPLAALKGLPDFTGDGQTSAFEHIRDIASLCNVHHVTQENVAVRLLAASFKGKTLEWFRNLLVASIKTWDQLGDVFTKFFKDKSDHLSLIE